MKEKFLKTILQEIDKVDVVSFDVFDTLLLRPFTEPRDLFTYIEEKYNVKGYAKKRVDAESRARKRQKTKEITLDDIYSEIPEYEPFKHVEINCEKVFLYPNKQVKKLYDYALRKVKKLIVVSDMYLSRKDIEEILVLNGYTEFEDIFVSCEYNVTKSNGKLFEAVLQKYPLSQYKILHVGDNVISDYEQPQKHKIKAIYISRNTDKYLNYKKYRLNDSKTLLGSVILKACADRYIDSYDDYWHQFGFEFAGPVCFAFTKWIWDKTHEDSQRKSVLFVARDGYLLKQIYEKLLDKSGGVQHSTHYVYAPRKLNIICRLAYQDDISDFEKKHFISLLNYFKDIVPEFDDINWQLEDYIEFTKNNWFALKNAAKKEFEDYVAYIHSLSLEKIYLVDSTTASYSAQNLIENVVGEKVDGLYYYQRRVDEKYRSYTFQIEKHNVLLCFPLMEFMMSAPTPPVSVVKECKPVFSSKNEFEDKRINLFKKMEKGVLEFCDWILEHNLEDIKWQETVVRNWYNNFCKNGNKEDKDAFSKIKFSNDPDHATLMELNVFTKAEENRNIKEDIFRWLTLHPKLYGVARKIYRMVRR